MDKETKRTLTMLRERIHQHFDDFKDLCDSDDELPVIAELENKIVNEILEIVGDDEEVYHST